MNFLVFTFAHYSPLHINSEKARLNRSVKTASDKSSKAAEKRSQMGRRSYNSQLSSANGGTSVAKRVVIDGVTYEFEADGVTLKKVEGKLKLFAMIQQDHRYLTPFIHADAFSTKQRKRKLDNRDGSQAYVQFSTWNAFYYRVRLSCLARARKRYLLGRMEAY
jgi:hypothetical protein